MRGACEMNDEQAPDARDVDAVDVLTASAPIAMPWRTQVSIVAQACEVSAASKRRRTLCASMSRCLAVVQAI